MTREEIFQKITELLTKGETFAVATIIETKGSAPRHVGTKMIVTKGGYRFGTIGGDTLELAIKRDALRAMREMKHKIVEYKLEEECGGLGMRCGGEVKVFIEVIQPETKLIIIGSGSVASQIAKIGSITGFSTIVIDPFAKKEEFPDPIQVIPEDVKQGLSKVNITTTTSVVIATRHQYDELALEAVINSEAAYIGMLGSENRVIATFNSLMQKGISKEKLLRVYAPIGLHWSRNARGDRDQRNRGNIEGS
jgi:xanthine dehydrogenase accessory factor